MAVTGALVGFAALATGAAVALQRLAHVDPPDRLAETMGTLAFLPAMGSILAVGTVIVTRRSRNLVGWLCLLSGLLASLTFVSGSYTDAELARDAAQPPLDVVAWCSLWLGSAWVSVLVWIPLVFPDGRLPSSRWRPAAWAAAALLGGLTAWRALSPVVPDDVPMASNPFGLEAAVHIAGVIDVFTDIALAAVLATGVAALWTRYTRGTSDQRQQLKWLAYAMLVIVVVYLTWLVAQAAISDPASDLAFGLAYATPPVAIGLAVLRYRLYDIDRIIRRTLVYIVITAVLGGLYAGGVLLAGSVLSDGQRSSLAVAVSTLLAAAAFQPVRRSAQQAIDRRFNRQRFDAQRRVVQFGTAVRQQVDADVIARDLARVARDAVQPSAIGVWMRPVKPASRWPSR